MGLEQYTDQELRDELKRRSLLRKEQKEDFTRCESCKHCGTGYISRSSYKRGSKTIVCLNKKKEVQNCPVPCYFVTSRRDRACDDYEAK